MEDATIDTILQLASGGRNAHYHVLHVDTRATVAEIRKHYRKLALRVRATRAVCTVPWPSAPHTLVCETGAAIMRPRRAVLTCGGLS